MLGQQIFRGPWTLCNMGKVIPIRMRSSRKGHSNNHYCWDAYRPRTVAIRTMSDRLENKVDNVWCIYVPIHTVHGFKPSIPVVCISLGVPHHYGDGNMDNSVHRFARDYVLNLWSQVKLLHTKTMMRLKKKQCWWLMITIRTYLVCY